MHAAQPCWSPDGTRIAFSGGPVGHASRIFEVPSAGGAPEPITDAGPIDTGASWSADGNSVVFARNVPPGASGQAGLYVMDRKTKKATLLPGSENLDQPAWSPDGRFVAATNRAGTELLLLTRETGQWRPLASGDGLGTPYWSKDGKYVYCQEMARWRSPCSDPACKAEPRNY